ncbi:hypothetical protein E4T56_gene10558 [Termitomyces sp. T112]|nr:hypothetical protein E4T56_gene10558 [Termitomyces sp. T112]
MKLGRNQRDSKPVSPPAGGDFSTPRPETRYLGLRDLILGGHDSTPTCLYIPQVGTEARFGVCIKDRHRSLSDMDNTTTNTLLAIGHDLLRSFAGTVVETFFLAIYTVFVILASRVLIRKAPSRVSIITLLAVLLMYIMALVMWAFDVANFVHQVQIPLMSNPDQHIDKKYHMSQQKVFSLIAPLDLLYSYMALLGDSIVVWRVFVLWGQSRRRWVVVLPLALLVGSLITSILLTFCVARLGTAIINGGFEDPAFCKNAQMASYVTPTATTTVATILIAWKSWEHRRAMPIISTPNSLQSSKTTGVLLMLVESGVLYFLFFLTIVIGNTSPIQNNSRLSFAFFVYTYSTSVVVGLYPTLVIFLSHYQFSTHHGSLRRNVQTRKATHTTSGNHELTTYRVTSANYHDVEGFKGVSVHGVERRHDAFGLIYETCLGGMLLRMIVFIDKDDERLLGRLPDAPYHFYSSIWGITSAPHISAERSTAWKNLCLQIQQKDRVFAHVLHTFPTGSGGTVAQLAPSCPKAGHMICECKVGVSTLAECACVENTLDTTWVISTPPGSLRPHVLD